MDNENATHYDRGQSDRDWSSDATNAGVVPVVTPGTPRQPPATRYTDEGEEGDVREPATQAAPSPTGDIGSHVDIKSKNTTPGKFADL